MVKDTMHTGIAIVFAMGLATSVMADTVADPGT